MPRRALFWIVIFDDESPSVVMIRPSPWPVIVLWRMLTVLLLPTEIDRALPEARHWSPACMKYLPAK